MSVVEGGDYLWINQPLAVDNKVWDESTDKFPPCIERILALLLDRATRTANSMSRAFSYSFSSRPGFNSFKTAIAPPMIS